MGRDLLYKPPVPTVLKDEETKEGDKPKVKKTRELGHVGESRVGKEAATQTPRAFRHTYFNSDSSGVAAPNLGARTARALRGSNDATDLRKVVLPAAHGIEHPAPEVLRDALDLMGLDAQEGLSLASLLQRHASLARGAALPDLQARMAQLEAMVKARRAALQRMRAGNSATLKRALEAGPVEDAASAGTLLIRETAAQGDGMHRRLAKMLGVKLP
jgi:hypothetical protein